MREGILVCLPMYAGFCIRENVLSLIGLVRDLERGGVDYDVVSGSDSAVHRNRYYLTDTFMRSEWSHMLFIDSDIEFSGEDVKRLWDLCADGADVAVGAYRLKKDGSELAAHSDGRLLKLSELPSEPFEVDYAGTGFMMVQRHVFERLAPTLPVIETPRGSMPRWWSFDVHAQADGTCVELPEDYSFCERLRALGMRVMMDPAIALKHYGLKGY